MDEKKLDLLYDHYKDTNEIQRDLLQKRNLYTLLIVGLIGINSFLVASPDQAHSVSTALIEENIGKVSIDFSHINTILLFALMWISTMYFRVCRLIEGRYCYIKTLEEKLKVGLGEAIITREGEGYLNDYPWFKNVIHFIYTYCFPLILALAALAKIVIEWRSISSPLCDGHFILDAIFIGATCIVSLLYFGHRIRMAVCS